MRFLWIKILFLYGIVSVYLWWVWLEALTIIFKWGLLFEIGIFYGKMGSISEKVIDLFFMAGILKTWRRPNCAAKVAILLLLEFFVEDKWAVMLNLLSTFGLTIIYLQVCGRCFGLTCLVDRWEIESAVVLLMENGAFHLLGLNA
jgi:hypothetical protein